MAKSQTVRISIAITPDFDDKFKNWAKRLGVSKSQFGNMCMQAGLNSLIRAVSPEEAFSPETIVKVIEAARKQNVQLDFNDFQEGKANM
jgi:hypothetical protein